MQNQEKRARIEEIKSLLQELHEEMKPLNEKLGKLQVRYGQLWREKDVLERELIQVKYLKPKEAPTHRIRKSDNKLNQKVKKLMNAVDPSQLESLLGSMLEEC